MATLISAAIAVGPRPAHAVAFIASGTVTGPAADIGKTFSLTADYTPSSGPVATINSATLVVGSQTWSSVIAGASPNITVASARNAFTITTQFMGSTPGDVGNIFTSLSMTLASTVTLPSAQATEANINTLYGSQSSFLGTLTIVGNTSGNFGGNTIVLQGNPPAPPPATSAPGPLPLLGAASAFGFSRRFRQRIHRLNSSSPSLRPFA